MNKSGFSFRNATHEEIFNQINSLDKTKTRQSHEFPLTHYVPVLPSYGNQSIGLHSKYMRATLLINSFMEEAFII